MGKVWWKYSWQVHLTPYIAAELQACHCKFKNQIIFGTTRLCVKVCCYLHFFEKAEYVLSRAKSIMIVHKSNICKKNMIFQWNNDFLNFTTLPYNGNKPPQDSCKTTQFSCFLTLRSSSAHVIFRIKASTLSYLLILCWP